MSLKPLAVLALLAAVPLPAQTTLTPGQTVTGTLREGDARMEGSFYDAYVVRGPSKVPVLVTMHSDDVDAYLVSGRESGGRWEEESSNDDAGGSTDARLIAFPGEDGTVQVRAAASGQDEVGGYTLRVRLLGEPAAVPIRPGQTVRGRLEQTDHEGVTGYEDHYVIQAAPDDTLTIQVESAELDPAVAAGGAYGGVVSFEAYDDDGGPGTDAALVVRTGAPERYHLVVHAFVPGSTGAYTLRLLSGAHPGPVEYDRDKGSGASEPADGATWSAVDTAVVMDSIVYADTAIVAGGVMSVDTTIAVLTTTVPWTATEADSTAADVVVPLEARVVHAGEQVTGELDLGPQDEEGRFFELFTYTARAGERLRIAVISEHLDTRVAIGTGTYCRFDALAEDDDGGRGWNPELEWTAPESGEYTIRVSAAFPDEAGAFALRVHSAP